MDRFFAAVVIPTLNNESVFDVVKDVRNLGYETIVVDDGSDVSVEERLTCDNKTHIVTHHKNLGKGAAIKSGAKKAMELGYSHIVSMDADGQHIAGEIYKLTNAVDFQDDVIVIGARDFDIANVPKSSKIGRNISNFWASIDTSCKIADSLSGFRLYPVSILNLPTKNERFDWEIEVLVRHAWLKKKIVEVKVSCYYPKAEDRVSHFKKWRDTLAIILVHCRLLPLRILLLRGYV